MNYSPTLSVGKAKSDIVIFCSLAWKQQHGKKFNLATFILFEFSLDIVPYPDIYRTRDS